MVEILIWFTLLPFLLEIMLQMLNDDPTAEGFDFDLPKTDEMVNGESVYQWFYRWWSQLNIFFALWQKSRVPLMISLEKYKSFPAHRCKSAILAGIEG